jgi:hypothetical protein
LESALFEKQRPGAATVLDDAQKQRIIAMVCSNPPEGRARWTVRLVAQEAVKRRLVPRNRLGGKRFICFGISRARVGRVQNRKMTAEGLDGSGRPKGQLPSGPRGSIAKA